MHIVLLEPEIPPNTGNVARLCAATHSALHLIEPLGFRLDDSQLKRAGMDYWEQVDWALWENWPAFSESLPANAQCWFVEQGGGRRYDAVDFGPEDWIGPRERMALVYFGRYKHAAAVFELLLVDLAAGEAFLEDVERRPAG